MKKNLRSVATLFLITFLISTSNYPTGQNTLASAAMEGEVEESINKISSRESVAKMGSNNIDSNFDNLMGLEECEDEDEECLKRRVIAEAHVDYIYTQHHKP